MSSNTVQSRKYETEKVNTFCNSKPRRIGKVGTGYKNIPVIRTYRL